MALYHFHLRATWPGGRNAIGDIQCGQLQTPVSIATGMGGPGVGTNPDEMLLGAAATCYLITLAALLERAELAVQALALDSDITVATHHGAFTCQQIVHRPHITLAADTSTEALRKAKYLATMAERRCMISNALRGNVGIVIQAQIDRAQ